MSLPIEDICPNCDGVGWYVSATRPDHRGEPEEVRITCECVIDNDEYDED